MRDTEIYTLKQALKSFAGFTCWSVDMSPEKREQLLRELENLEKREILLSRYQFPDGTGR
jgi:hypothetical protein